MVAAYLGRKLWRRVSRVLTSMQSRMGAAEAWTALPIEAAETLGLTPQPARLQVRGSSSVRSSAIFCVAGLVILAVAFIPIRHIMQLKNGIRTEGTVWRLQQNTAIHNSYAIYPEVQYTNTEGATVRFLDRAGENPSPYKVGDHVPVLYQPGEPESAMIDHGLRNWEPVVALLILGTVLTSLGFWTLRARLGAAEQSKVLQH
jgi:Protein of unknown function (DUF3592)